MSFTLSSVRDVSDLVRRLPKWHAGGVPTLVANASRGRSPERVAEAVAKARALVSDQDGTVTPGAQWLGFHDGMTSEHVAEDKAAAAAYFAGTRTPDDDRRVLFLAVERLIASGVTRSTFGELAARQVPRSGARRLFASFGADTAIVSYGLRPLVKSWSAEHGIPVGEFHALRLRWREENGVLHCVGYVDDTAVIESTKGYARERFCAARGFSGEEVLVLEDTPSALRHLRGPDNVAVLVLPSVDPLERRPAQRIRQLAEGGCFDHVDAFLVSDTLDPLADLRAG